MGGHNFYISRLSTVDSVTNDCCNCDCVVYFTGVKNIFLNLIYCVSSMNLLPFYSSKCIGGQFGIWVPTTNDFPNWTGSDHLLGLPMFVPNLVGLASLSDNLLWTVVCFFVSFLLVMVLSPLFLLTNVSLMVSSWYLLSLF